MNLDLEISSNVNYRHIQNFLKRQSQKWAPKIQDEVERTLDLKAVVDMIQINGIPLKDLFEDGQITKFQTRAKMSLSSITTLTNKLKIMRDIIIIVCLVASIYHHYNSLRWDLLAVDSVKLAIKIDKYAKRYIPAYKNLLEFLKLLVPDFAVKYVTFASNIFFSVDD